MTALTLASKSRARGQLLTAAGLDFTAVSPGVDEEPMKAALLAEGHNPREVADALAELKAVRVSTRRDGLVIGADQTLDLDGVLIDKAPDLAAVRATLLALRGRSHVLHSAVVVAQGGQPIWREVKSAKLHMRPFSDAFLDTYLAREGEALLGSVGAYYLEGEGLQLFDRIDGDYFTILGLPMLGLLDLLRRHGALEDLALRREDEAMLTGAALVAGVVGDPVAHSLSPRIHGAWIEAAGLDAAYVPFAVQAERFAAFVQGLRGGGLRGLNVTIPHKHDALALADEADLMARRSGAANLLLFHTDGTIEARNTDGLGLLGAFAEQAPGLDLTSGPVLVLGAGGAARGACAALVAADVTEIRVVNRTWAKAAALAEAFPRTVPFELSQVAQALTGSVAVVNATSGGLNCEDDLDLPLEHLAKTSVVMDMVYKPLRTGLLRAAEARGLKTVDGLAMLIGQARPSFEAFYGRPPPVDVDVRAICLAATGQKG